jgi:hypothetical protein
MKIVRVQSVSPILSEITELHVRRFHLIYDFYYRIYREIIQELKLIKFQYVIVVSFLIFNYFS